MIFLRYLITRSVARRKLNSNTTTKQN